MNRNVLTAENLSVRGSQPDNPATPASFRSHEYPARIAIAQPTLSQIGEVIITLREPSYNNLVG